MQNNTIKFSTQKYFINIQKIFTFFDFSKVKQKFWPIFMKKRDSKWVLKNAKKRNFFENF